MRNLYSEASKNPVVLLEIAISLTHDLTKEEIVSCKRNIAKLLDSNLKTIGFIYSLLLFERDPGLRKTFQHFNLKKNRQKEIFLQMAEYVSEHPGLKIEEIERNTEYYGNQVIKVTLVKL